MMNKTDYLIRQKLNAHESTFSASVLDGVLASINEKEDTRKYPMWYWVSCALLILAVISLVPSFLNSEKSVATTTIISKESLVIDHSNELTPTQDASNNNLSSIAAILLDSTVQKAQSKKVVNRSAGFMKVDQLNSILNTKLSSQSLSEYATTSQKTTSELELSNQEQTELDDKVQLSFNQLPIVINQLNPLSSKRVLKEPIGCPTFNDKARKPIYIEAYISHDLPFRSLVSNSPESQAEYINRRNDTESAMYSFHSGVRLSGNLISNFVLRVGLDYAQITEKFKVTDLAATREVIIRDADGNILSTTTEEGTRDIVKYNKFKSYNIPVSIGWQSKLGKLSLAVHGGAAISMISSHHGVILGPESMPSMARIVSSGSGGELVAFKNDLGLSAIGSVGVAYPLKERLDLIIEPNIKYILNPINISSYELEQRMFTVGLLTGVRYKF